MRDEAFRARIAAIEWHCTLWLPHYGRRMCEAMMQHCSEVTEALYYGVEKPEPDTGDDEIDQACINAEILFDSCVFNSAQFE